MAVTRTIHLVADIGGTHARLALADPAGALHAPASMPTGDDLLTLVRDYLQQHGVAAVDTFACAAAGPVDSGGGIALTNRTLQLDPADLRRASGARQVRLINDFAALAHAVPWLGDDGRCHCGGGEPVAGAAIVVLGPGTGLGMAASVCIDGRWRALPGEGGHADLAPVDATEQAAWQALAARYGHVSAETVLCGPGLLRLHEALGHAALSDPQALARAADRGEPEAVETQRLFVRWLGRVAGNLALTLDARGGVFLAGGILPAWGTRFDRGEFRAGFEDKPRMRARLRGIPSYLITHPYPALLGLARWAAQGCPA